MVTLKIIDDSNPSHLSPEYLSKYGNGDIFIETGTHFGDTVQLALDFGYNTIHSIELNADLYNKAVERFKNNSQVKIWLGDSIDKLKEIIEIIGDSPATFWLDAHASGHLVGGKSGGSPVIDELSLILDSQRNHHTIFIDDKRLFGSAEWSFVTENQAIELIKKINPNYNIHHLDGHIPGDVLCATIKEQKA